MASMTPFRGRLRIRHLEIVLQVTEHGNLSKAASVLHMTQSGLSRAMTEIEEIAGGRLFERSAKGMSPTALGVAVCRHARVLLADLRKAEADLSAVARGELGSMSVGCFAMFAAWPLADAVHRFRELHPKVDVSVEIGPHERLVQLLDAGELDVLISRVPDTMHNATYRIVPFDDDPAVLVCRSGHPLVGAAVLALADCVRYPWITALPVSRIRNELATRLRMLGLDEPAEVGALSLDFGQAMIELGDYLWMLPGSVASVRAHRGQVTILPVQLGLTRSPLAAIWRRDRPSTIQMRAFADVLEQILRPPAVGW